MTFLLPLFPFLRRSFLLFLVINCTEGKPKLGYKINVGKSATEFFVVAAMFFHFGSITARLRFVIKSCFGLYIRDYFTILNLALVKFASIDANKVLSLSF